MAITLIASGRGRKPGSLNKVSQILKDALTESFERLGGAAYLVSKAIKTAKVVGFEDLGMEAIYEFDVVDMPVTVAVDAGGTSAHITGPAEWSKRIASGEFKGITLASV